MSGLKAPQEPAQAKAEGASANTAPASSLETESQRRIEKIRKFIEEYPDENILGVLI